MKKARELIELDLQSETCSGVSARSILMHTSEKSLFVKDSYLYTYKTCPLKRARLSSPECGALTWSGIMSGMY